LLYFLLLGGIERAEIAPGTTVSVPIAFLHIPFSHGLVANLGVAVLASLAASTGLCSRGGKGRGASAVALSIALLSHWLLDVLGHAPDMPLLSQGLKLGLRLYDHPLLMNLLEIGLVAAGLVVYCRAERLGDLRSLAAPVGFGLLLVALQLLLRRGAIPASLKAMGIQSLLGLLDLAGLAAVVEWRVRRSQSRKAPFPAQASPSV